MRKILFRGKRIDNGEWVEGHYGEYMLMSGESIPGISIPNKESVCGSICYDVEASTVGQYTGVVDKNGKKIFEGDIIKTCGQHSCFDKVEFLDGLAGFYAVNDDIHIPAELATLKKNFIEVIGNIHDNPELLEVEK